MINVNQILNKSLLVLIEQFIKEKPYLAEIASYAISDDGPGSWIDFNNYKKNSATSTEKLGYEILSYMIDKEDMTKNDFRVYPDGPVNAISFGPAGMPDKLTTQNQVDASGEVAYNMWKKHITKINKQLAWTFIEWLDPEVFEDKF